MLVTQNESIFLPSALDYFIRRALPCYEVQSCIILGRSSVGGASSFERLRRLWAIFGTYFVLRNVIVHVWKLLRGNSVEETARFHGVPVIKLSENINSPESIDQLRTLGPDFIVNVAGSEIFRNELITLPKIATLNLHTSKLPEYKGMLPTFWVMLEDEEETAVSVFIVDEGIDTGPVVVQNPLRISGLSQFELIRITKIMGMDAIIESVEYLARGGRIKQSGESSQGSYYSFPKKSDVKRFRKNGKRFF